MPDAAPDARRPLSPVGGGAPASLTWTTPDGTHRIEIQPSNSGKRRAWCRCGWQGKTRLSTGPATRDGMEHLSAVTHGH